MTRIVRRLCLLVVLALSCPVLLAQDAEKHVFVTVVDNKDGMPLSGLTAEHFAVREGGRDRDVVRVERLLAPAHVAVLVDTSAAGGSPDEPFRSAVVDFVQRLASTNYVAVYSFGDRAASVVPFTQDQARLRSATTAMFGAVHLRSMLIDGIDRALQDMAAIEIARPVVIAITSESGEASGGSAGSAIKKLIAQSVSFHAISLSAGSTRAAPAPSNMTPAGVAAASQALTRLAATGEGDRERTQMLEQGTSVTGGSRQRITSTMALKQALYRVANELGNSYRLTFIRPGRDKIRDLQVGILVEGVTLRATAAPFGTR